jgi:outer membrane protein TolC
MNGQRRFRRLGILCLCPALAGCAVYQPAPLSLAPPLKTSLAALAAPPPPLSSRQVAALAVVNDPDLISARAQHGVAAAELLNAGLLPDPSATGGFAALISGPGMVPAVSGGLAQDLSALITYRANRQAAQAGLAQVDAGILWQEWQVAGQAQALCIAIAADGATLASLQADAAALAQVNQATQAQVTARNLTLAASAASLAALATTQAALHAAAQARAQDADQLDALLGLEPGVEIPATPPAAAALSRDAAARDIATLARRRPDLIALRYGYLQADARLRAAILTQFLPISLGASAGRDTSNVWTAGPQLTLNLPLFNRNRGGVAGAQAARGQLAAQFSASLAGAQSGAESLLARIAVLQGESAAAGLAASQARAMAAAGRSAFAGGALDALSAVNLTTAAGERQREAIALQAQLATAALGLNTILGIGLPAMALPPDGLP